MMCLVGGVGYMRGHRLGCFTDKVSWEERSKIRLKHRKENEHTKRRESPSDQEKYGGYEGWEAFCHFEQLHKII